MLESWSTGPLEVYWSTGPLEVYRFLQSCYIFEDCFCRESILYWETLCWNLGALVLWKCIGALDLWKCIDSNSPVIFLKTFFVENRFLYGETWCWNFGALVLWKCIWVLDLWKCIDSNSPATYLKAVCRIYSYMERLNAGNSEHWSFGSVSEHWTFGSVSTLIFWMPGMWCSCHNQYGPSLLIPVHIVLLLGSWFRTLCIFSFGCFNVFSCHSVLRVLVSCILMTLSFRDIC